jgi:hypothetical protein
MAISTRIHFPVLFILVPVTSVWATVDASRLRRRYSSELLSKLTGEDTAALYTLRPVVVFTVCLLLWIFGFPWYLWMRGRLITAVQERENR